MIYTMRHYLAVVITILAIGASCVLLASPALADQLDDSTEQPYAVAGHSMIQGLGKGYSGNLNEVSIEGSGADLMWFYLFYSTNDAPPYSGFTQIVTTGNNILVNGVTADSQGYRAGENAWGFNVNRSDGNNFYLWQDSAPGKVITWVFDNVTTNPDLYYWILLSPQSTITSLYKFYGSPLTDLNTSRLLLDYFYHGTETQTTQALWSFTNLVGGYNYEISPWATLDYPTASSTISDFEDWTVSYNLEEAPTGQYLKIKYGETPSTQYFDYYLGLPTATGTVDVFKQNQLSFGDYNAYVNLYSATGTLLTSSDYVYFSIVYSTSTGGAPPPEPPPTVDCEGNALCEIGNWIATSLSNLFSYWFNPSSASLNQFGTLNTSISGKVPFGYFGLLSSAFSNLSASGTPIATTTDLSDLHDIISPIDYVLGALMFFLFGFWLVRRISKMEL